MVDPLVAGATIVVGVRPESLVVGAGGVGTITATVHTIEWLGHERHVICNVGDQKVVVRQPIDGVAPAIGEVVQLTAEPEHLHLFDAATTERVN
jgi:ABC-type sugar transport system ATPase subunit